MPASGEFVGATHAIRKTDGGATVPENLTRLADFTGLVEARDRLTAMAPAVESIVSSSPGSAIVPRDRIPIETSLNPFHRSPASAYRASPDRPSRRCRAAAAP